MTLNKADKIAVESWLSSLWGSSKLSDVAKWELYTIEGCKHYGISPSQLPEQVDAVNKLIMFARKANGPQEDK